MAKPQLPEFLQGVEITDADREMYLPHLANSQTIQRYLKRRRRGLRYEDYRKMMVLEITRKLGGRFTVLQRIRGAWNKKRYAQESAEMLQYIKRCKW